MPRRDDTANVFGHEAKAALVFAPTQQGQTLSLPQEQQEP